MMQRLTPRRFTRGRWRTWLATYVLLALVWPAMIVATMLFMCLEMLLATSKALLPVKPKPKSAPRVGKREEVTV